MSSSQQPSNNSNHTNANQSLDYDPDRPSNAQRPSRPQMSSHAFDNRGQSHGNDFFEPMQSFPEDPDEDLPHEIVAALNANRRTRSNMHDEDESVFSDVVQDAFKKYQNEYSKYWTYDDAQEELYAQMEECWNYMAQETTPPDPPKPSVDQSQLSQLNPDAIEFKPSWLQSSSHSTNEGLPMPLTSSHAEEQAKNI